MPWTCCARVAAHDPFRLVGRHRVGRQIDAPTHPVSGYVPLMQFTVLPTAAINVVEQAVGTESTCQPLATRMVAGPPTPAM
jgi:hypothetical protein